MPELTIKFFGPSSTPSVLIDSELSDHLLRQFVYGELCALDSCKHFLEQVRELTARPEFDFGFGNAMALSVHSGQALLENVIAEIPRYRLPLPLLLRIAECWAEALRSPAHKFASQSFSVT